MTPECTQNLPAGGDSQSCMRHPLTISTCRREQGSSTPKKRSSDSPSPSEDESAMKRPTIRVHDVDVQMSDTTGESFSSQYGTAGPNVQRQPRGSHTDETGAERGS